jgi:negative regulator of sigma E activity
MWLVRPLHRSCERVREQLSIAQDGELSQLEAAHLDAHLARCASCRAFGAALCAVTRVLRTTPLEEPSFPIAIPGRNRATRRAFQVTAAAAVVLAAGIGSLDLANRESQRSATPAFPSRAVPQVNDALELDRSHLHARTASGLGTRIAR